MPFYQIHYSCRKLHGGFIRVSQKTRDLSGHIDHDDFPRLRDGGFSPNSLTQKTFQKERGSVPVLNCMRLIEIAQPVSSHGCGWVEPTYRYYDMKKVEYVRSEILIREVP